MIHLLTRISLTLKNIQMIHLLMRISLTLKNIQMIHLFMKSSQISSHSQEKESLIGRTPLHACTSITVNVTMILLLAFAVQHNLTNEAISDLLYLIDTICPKPNNTCKTLYNFKKFFSCLVMPTDFCYYCSDYFSPISSITTTLCTICKKSFKSIKGLSYFFAFFSE